MRHIGGLLAAWIAAVAFTYLPGQQAAAVSAVAIFIITAICVLLAENQTTERRFVPSLGRSIRETFRENQ